jgi:predicted dithiol-disulfide oxidoreductase (DUF899 family)
LRCRLGGSLSSWPTTAVRRGGPLVTNQTDLPGISAFIREPDGAIYQTYSANARGLELVNPAYQLLDLTALGRREEGLARPMSWVKLHDEYGV